MRTCGHRLFHKWLGGTEEVGGDFKEERKKGRSAQIKKKTKKQIRRDCRDKECAGKRERRAQRSDVQKREGGSRSTVKTPRSRFWLSTTLRWAIYDGLYD